MVQQQLQQAHELIEQGRIAEARQLLEALDDPTARLWLAQLNAAKRARKSGLVVPLPLLIAVALVIGIGALIVIILLTPTLITRMQNHPGVTSTVITDEDLRAALTSFCSRTVGSQTACSTWVQTAITQHRDAAANCIAQSSDNRTLAGCFTNAGVPPPA